MKGVVVHEYGGREVPPERLTRMLGDTIVQLFFSPRSGLIAMVKEAR